MISFKAYIMESNVSGNYVSIKAILNPDTLKVVSLLPDPIKPEKLHTTISYSKNTNVSNSALSKALKLLNIDTIHGTISGMDLLGENEESLALVLLIDSKELHDVFNQLHLLVPIKHSYDEFTPHVSIQYNISREFGNKFIKDHKKELIGQSVEFTNISHEALNDD